MSSSVAAGFRARCSPLTARASSRRVPLHDCKISNSFVNSLAVLGDGATVLAACGDGELNGFSWRSGGVRQTLCLSGQDMVSVTGVCVSGGTAWSACADGVVRGYDVDRI